MSMSVVYIVDTQIKYIIFLFSQQTKGNLSLNLETDWT